jgi:phenylacetic acid degradation operon negative regulatory protein
MNAHVAALVTRMQEQPSHTGSLIMTLMGDAIMPRGGVVALSTVLDLCAGLGIGAGVVRTAVSRLSADGWVVARRQGRASFYEIGPARRGEFVRAARHIFGPSRRPQVDQLSLILLESCDGREALRHRLARLGFVAWQGVMIAPERPLPPSVAADVLAVTATAADDTIMRIATKAWRLVGLAALYEDFMAAYRPVAAAARGFEPRDAIMARILMVHDYRKIMLRDPRLPGALLPDPWIGAAARRLCGAIYGDLLDQSERWLDVNALRPCGALPPADSSLGHRFGDLDLRGG